MPSIHDFVGGDYLKAADLNGQEPTWRLREFKIEYVKGDDGKEKKCIGCFHDQKKGLVIGCKANAVVLLEMFKTDQIDAWNQAVAATETWVQLYTEATNLGPGLRIRPAAKPPTDSTAGQVDKLDIDELDPALVNAVLRKLAAK